MNRTSLFALTLVAAVGIAFFTGTGVARNAGRPGPANNIATLNIQSVFEALKEREDRLKTLQVEAAELEGKFSAINQQIAQQRDAANKMPEGPAKEAAIEAALDRDVQANIDIKKAKTRLEKSQAAAIKSLFEKIQESAKVYAAKNGVTMVMAADDWVQISPRATSQEATQMMGLRRFLYVAKEHDITAELIKQMNADYAASKPAAPAGGTPAPAGN